MKHAIRTIGRVLMILVIIAALAVAGMIVYVKTVAFGYAREVSDTERVLRDRVVDTAKQWLGHNEADGSHGKIIDLYNAHTPLAQGYMVQYDDNWCAAFGSAAAIQCSLTDIIPTECGCQRQIGLFQDMDCWVEDDGYVPLPGDYIFYCWSDKGIGDCTGWSDHVGIVVGTAGSFIKVIEGNYDNAVSYHIIPVNAPTIRGFGIPNYANHK